MADKLAVQGATKSTAFFLVLLEKQQRHHMMG